MLFDFVLVLVALYLLSPLFSLVADGIVGLIDLWR